MQSVLTVIVPVYNAEPYIEQCISSICKQNLDEMRIVIIDDGSTDKSSKICDDYALKDSRILVIHQNNMGKLNARKKGLELADSKYVTFVDADDWIDDGTYLTMLPYMNKNIDIIMFGKILEKGKRGREYYQSRYRHGFYQRNQIEIDIFPTMIWDTEKCQIGVPQSLCDKLFKTTLLKSVYKEMDELGRLNMAEDAVVLFPVFERANSLYIMKDNFYHYRQENTNVPEYIRSDHFFDDLYKWYKYLHRHLSFDTATEQLEYLYMKYVNQRKLVYGTSTFDLEYMFPFDKVPTKSRIIIWGAGNVGQTYYLQVNRINYCEIVAWVDNASNLYSKNVITGKHFFSMQLEYDFIIIAVNANNVVQEIKRELLLNNIPEHKIV